MIAVCQCPECKGKGYGANPEMVFMSIMIPFVYAIERLENDNNGITRRTCKRCGGTGFIKVKVLK